MIKHCLRCGKEFIERLQPKKYCTKKCKSLACCERHYRSGKASASQHRYKISDKGKATNSRYYKSSKGKAISLANCRARKLKLQTHPIFKEEIKLIYKNRPSGYHVDHIIPLSHPLVCGLHVPCNLQYLPAADNIKKKNHYNPLD